MDGSLSHPREGVSLIDTFSLYDRHGDTLSVDDEVRYRMRCVLLETGPSVAITSITNILAFSIGATTPTAEIQLFSIGNATAVAVDFIFQVSR